ncbi:hypothetical protein V2H45_20320 [Tumidithrix elongata RA019]|uniref:Uncharacterized protein n=1 Tax=Tumidithrix elongata BACA0141 TaxID=2716417 RepID=A0AAW9Q7B7_9CYAN|nr:hypothetical protein [Tumidithrix elongata RA019]
MAVDSWQWTVDSWQLIVGSGQWTVGSWQCDRYLQYSFIFISGAAFIDLKILLVLCDRLFYYFIANI